MVKNHIFDFSTFVRDLLGALAPAKEEQLYALLAFFLLARLPSNVIPACPTRCH